MQRTSTDSAFASFTSETLRIPTTSDRSAPWPTLPAADALSRGFLVLRTRLDPRPVDDGRFLTSLGADCAATAERLMADLCEWGGLAVIA